MNDWQRALCQGFGMLRSRSPVLECHLHLPDVPLGMLDLLHNAILPDTRQLGEGVSFNALGWE